MSKDKKIVKLSDEVAKVLCWVATGDLGVSPDTLWKQMRPKARADFRLQAARVIMMLAVRGVLVARGRVVADDRSEGVVRVANKIVSGQWRLDAMLDELDRPRSGPAWPSPGPAWPSPGPGSGVRDAAPDVRTNPSADLGPPGGG